ncbi:MAG: type II toxin-antitoxin system PemK/MazF family toxin [Candidatus Absconditabacteria bacterium]|nr:type II toxin-antitoxin system PemK/MazF family toxin [Candidatus Absconditabacteria bacterium]
MHIKKLNKIGSLIENIKNDINMSIISDFLDWFYEKLCINFNKNCLSLKLNKGDIVFVNLGKNIGSELNKNRPCLVYSLKKANFGDTVVVLPLKTYKGKFNNSFNVLLKLEDVDGLFKDSIVDILAIKQVSKKRINKRIGKLKDYILLEIDEKVLNNFGIKK